MGDLCPSEMVAEVPIISSYLKRKYRAVYDQQIHDMLTAPIRFSLTSTETLDPLECLKALETSEENTYKTAISY